MLSRRQFAATRRRRAATGGEKTVTLSSIPYRPSSVAARAASPPSDEHLAPHLVLESVDTAPSGVVSRFPLQLYLYVLVVSSWPQIVECAVFSAGGNNS